VTLTKKILLLLTAAAMVLAVFLETLPAQTEEMHHSGHGMSGMAMGTESPSTAGYKAAMDKMHKDSGDPLYG
jgi:hypothetical protein